MPSRTPRLKENMPRNRRSPKKRSPRTKPDQSTRQKGTTGKAKNSRMPQVHYDPSLPIFNCLPDIENALRTGQVVIVAGETGSGKTTQIPLACLRTGRGVRGMIGHTQPRRLAARTVADRIASQLDVRLGEEVGFAVRFEDQVSSSTLVKIMTDGLLLTEIRRDRSLEAYDTIIVDEAHERSINIDFLLGYLKMLLLRRRDLKVVVTSATIDVKAFSNYFDNAPVIRVEGRGFPVEVRYRPVLDSEQDSVRSCIEEIQSEGHQNVRDILMFLSGEREILDWSHWFSRHYSKQLDVLPLYARLPTSEQKKIFTKSDRQRVLLSTNVAETSLTVPNVRYVIDSGNARLNRYSLQSRIQRLPIEPISQASADQRAGRCGRVAPGTCFRLYDEPNFERRKRYSDPEIRRCNLASVVLQMLVFRFGDIEEFPFLDPPESSAIRSAKRSLEELGALKEGSLTSIGRQMALLPVDPRLARMLLEAHKKQSLREVLIIVSALAAQDPRVRPIEKGKLADEAHEQFRDTASDFMSFVQLWSWAEDQRQSLTRNQFRRLLEKSFVSPQRYEEWRSLHRQLRLACTRMKLHTNKEDAEYSNIHSAILSGSLSFVGLRIDNDMYLGVRELKFRLHPGSVLTKKKPKWVVGAEIAQTSQNFARHLARIEPKWIESYAGSLTKLKPHDPYWCSRRNEAMVLVDLSLAGLPLAQDRKKPLKVFDQPRAHAMFALHGLVRNDCKVSVAEIEENRSLVHSLREVQARKRRTDIVVREEHLADFYVQRLPQEIVNAKQFLSWYNKSDATSRQKLQMSSENVLRTDDIHLRAGAFPSDLTLGEQSFRMKYQFNPEGEADGVSLIVPIDKFNDVHPVELEWLVPGFLEEKCSELLRSLPKQTRKLISPIASTCQTLLARLTEEQQYRKGRLLSALEKAIRNEFGVDIESSLWRPERLAKHLFMNIQVIDHQKRLIDQDRDYGSLSARINRQIESQFASDKNIQQEQVGLTTFPNDGITWNVSLKTRTGTIPGFLRIVDRGTSVDLVVSHKRDDPKLNSLRGLCRLVAMEENQSVDYLRTIFAKDAILASVAASEPSLSNLFDNLVLATIANIYFDQQELPSSRSDFETLRQNHRGQLVAQGLKLLSLMSDAFSLRHNVINLTNELQSSVFEEVKQDLTLQLRTLFPQSFPFSVPFDRLRDVRRYLEAMQKRITNIHGQVSRDRTLMSEVVSWERRLIVLGERYPGQSSLDYLFHLIQEYRVSLFGQGMKTRVRVSPKRLGQAFDSIESTLGEID